MSFGRIAGIQVKNKRVVLLLCIPKFKLFFVPLLHKPQSPLLSGDGQRLWALPLQLLSSCFLVFCFCLFRAAPTAYGSSKARGRIGATAASLHHSHSNTRSEPILWPTPQLTESRILNPLIEATDRALILMNPSRVHYHWATTGNSQLLLSYCCSKAWLDVCGGLPQNSLYR